MMGTQRGCKKFRLFSFGWRNNCQCVACVEERAANHPYAKATTPDELIAEAVIKDIFTNYDDWAVSQSNASYFMDTSYYVLINAKKDLRFRWTYTKYRDKSVFRDCYLGDVRFDEEQMRKISTYLRNQQDARAANAEMIKRLEENKKKWDLAESLLGMTRVDGALVPKDQIKVNEVTLAFCNKRDGCKCKKHGCRFYQGHEGE